MDNSPDTLEIDTLEIDAQKWKTEYDLGFHIGLLHDYKSPLYAENLRKARQYHPEPLADAYWRGYIDGKFVALHPAIPRPAA